MANRAYKAKRRPVRGAATEDRAPHASDAVMIGEQRTGRLAAVTVSAVAHEGLRVEVGGKPACLAVLDEQGRVIASGPLVAEEVEAVAINSYRAFLRGAGHLKVFASPDGDGEALTPGEFIAPPMPRRGAKGST